MSQFPKIKQIAGLPSALDNKALANEVLKIANNLSDVDASIARSNLAVYSQSQIDAKIVGATQARQFNTLTELEAVTDLKDLERIFISDDGDNKWAMYVVVENPDGTYTNATLQRIADQDIFENAMSSTAVKSSYESNPDTNAFTDSHKAIVDKFTSNDSSIINIDDLQTLADNAMAKAQLADGKADNALDGVANLDAEKLDKFTEHKETFTGIEALANITVELTVANNVDTRIRVQVFINGIAANASASNGSNLVEIIPPYDLETDDEILVYYASA